MVRESVVLFWIKHFEQCRCRVTTKILSHFVNFIEQKQRIAHADLGQALQNTSHHRTNVGAAVPSDLGLIAHATQSHAHKFAVGGASNRLTE